MTTLEEVIKWNIEYVYNKIEQKNPKEKKYAVEFLQKQFIQIREDKSIIYPMSLYYAYNKLRCAYSRWLSKYIEKDG